MFEEFQGGSLNLPWYHNSVMIEGSLPCLNIFEKMSIYLDCRDWMKPVCYGTCASTGVARGEKYFWRAPISMDCDCVDT